MNLLGFKSLQELNHHMMPSQWVKRMSAEQALVHHMEVCQQAVQEARRSFPCELDVSFGESEKQKVDFYFSPDHKDPGDGILFIYIHGGYWQALGKDCGATAAHLICQSGYSYAAVGYDLAPSVSLTVIVEEIRRAIVFIAKRYPNAKCVVSGHSTGAHLSACVMNTAWEQYGLDTCPIKATVLFDGIYDLRPFQLCEDNEAVQVTQNEITKLSPLLMSKKELSVPKDFPCLLVTCENTTPEFIKQQVLYHQFLLECQVSATLIHLPKEDHFSLINSLREPDYLLSGVILEFLKRAV